MSVLTSEPAPAKINLCLFLGPPRADGRHELLTLFDSLTLCDELEIAESDSESDQVICDRVEGPNLVTGALSALRAVGWDAPALSVRIRKRIPIAAGMGGGSADAAAMLRLAPRLAPVADRTLAEIAFGLGADVPGQLHPGPSLATGAGEIVEPLPRLPAYGVLVLPQPFALSTADVFAQADRLGPARPAPELTSLRRELAAALPAALPAHLIVNDLQPAALSLRAEIADALTRAAGAGADQVIVCGSGPTSIGIFWGSDGADRAAAAAHRVRGAHPGAVAARPVGAGVRSPMANE
jgi:4-diphosphocytidyl-2-C-methyl-D-erythritol kinase